MSLKQSSNSVFDTDSVLEISELSNSESLIDKEKSSFYSSGSSLELSNIQSSAEASFSLLESSHIPENKIDSVKSLWSAEDASWDLQNLEDTEKDMSDIHSHKILPNNVSPFVESHGIVRYNFERGVNPTTPLLVGSRKLTGRDGESGYHPSHLVFDPRKGTLAVGHDINNGWSNLSNYSLISGIGNTTQLDGSFVSGSNNHINDKSVPATKNNGANSIPSSCAIIGGNNNTIENSIDLSSSSAIVASSGVVVNNCEDTVVVGMRAVPGQQPFNGYKESLISRNIYGLQSIHVGPLRSDQQRDEVLDVNGNAWIENDLNINNHLNSNSASFNNVVATNATFQNVSVSNITNHSHYVEGNSSDTTGTTGIVNFNVLPGDGLNIIYANPINGDIYINLGTNNNNIFEPNRLITIKDVTLEFSRTSSNNVYIWVPPTVRIENYANGTGGYSLTSSTGGAYILNTNGGSVTFRYFQSGIPGSLPTWIIENQFIGNTRINPTIGFTFIPANDSIRTRLMLHNK